MRKKKKKKGNGFRIKKVFCYYLFCLVQTNQHLVELTKFRPRRIGVMLTS